MENKHTQEHFNLLMKRNMIDVLFGLCVLVGMVFWCWLILSIFMLITGDSQVPTINQAWVPILCNLLLIPLGMIRAKLTKKIKSTE